MHIKWINKGNVNEEVTEKRIYIYGYGSLGKTIGKWLQKNGIRDYYYCVDPEYMSEGLRSAEECFEQVRSGRALCIYAIGEAEAFETFRDRDFIPVVYAIFDPYEFWVWDEEAYLKHLSELEEAREMLADELSKKTFDRYLQAKRENNGSEIISDAPCCRKYFNELTEIHKEGIYVDCGAYNGDTIELFRAHYKDYQRKIYAFEPDDDSYQVLQERYGTDKNVKLFKKGLWNSITTLSFCKGAGERSEIISDGGIKIEVVPLDEEVNETVSYVKIGTANPRVILNGMRKIAKRDMPVIAAFALFSFEDLLGIPKTLRELENEYEKYKIYLRQHSLTSCGLLLYYAIPESR
ncbi:MAG: hypothetical protein K5697_04610 [Lachnospiraceae bacterium]|nr:hypothetical protein [Lachnospiraceae bacterium]